jgi:putative transcriptional regulator
MRTGRRYRSRVMASVHEIAEGLTGAGVMNKQTMREFDKFCLTRVSSVADAGGQNGLDGVA